MAWKALGAVGFARLCDARLRYCSLEGKPELRQSIGHVPRSGTRGQPVIRAPVRRRCSIVQRSARRPLTIRVDGRPACIAYCTAVFAFRKPAFRHERRIPSGPAHSGSIIIRRNEIHASTPRMRRWSSIPLLDAAPSGYAIIHTNAWQFVVGRSSHPAPPHGCWTSNAQMTRAFVRFHLQMDGTRSASDLSTNAPPRPDPASSDPNGWCRYVRPRPDRLPEFLGTPVLPCPRTGSVPVWSGFRVRHERSPEMPAHQFRSRPFGNALTFAKPKAVNLNQPFDWRVRSDYPSFIAIRRSSRRSFSYDG